MCPTGPIRGTGAWLLIHLPPDGTGCNRHAARPRPCTAMPVASRDGAHDPWVRCSSALHRGDHGGVLRAVRPVLLVVSRALGATHVVDGFIGLYETSVDDRRDVRAGSVRARLLRMIDYLAARLTHVYLVDTRVRAERVRAPHGRDSLVVSLPVGAPRGRGFPRPAPRTQAPGGSSTTATTYRSTGWIGSFDPLGQPSWRRM